MNKKVIWLMVTGLITLALLAVSCYPTAPKAPAAPAAKEQAAPKEEASATEVKMSSFTYVPATITIPVTINVGTTVTWTNIDPQTHTVTSQDNLFDSGNLSKDATFSYTFTQKGTFEYHCKIHPAMKGKVVVE